MTNALNRAYGAFKVPHDGCEWNPVKHRGSETSDAHFTRTFATRVVGGAGDGVIRYRLCDACAALPLFRNRRQQPIARKAAAV